MIPFIAQLLSVVRPCRNYKHRGRKKVRHADGRFFPEWGTNGPYTASDPRLSKEGYLKGDGSVGAWHQIANATTTIAFSISLFLASQMYVASRLSAAEFAKSRVLKPQGAGYRALHVR